MHPPLALRCVMGYEVGMFIGLFKNLSLLVAFALLGLSGCSSMKSYQASCDQADWYELGRRDGSQGSTSDRLTQHRQPCAKQFHSDWETMYTNGRNAGLVEYCEPKNGFELGRMGIGYMYVCPSTVEPQFLNSYRKGQRAHDLELESKRIDLQIDQLAQRLLVSNNKYDQKEMSSELEQLKKLRSVKDKELSKIISN